MDKYPRYRLSDFRKVLGPAGWFVMDSPISDAYVLLPRIQVHIHKAIPPALAYQMIKRDYGVIQNA